MKDHDDVVLVTGAAGFIGWHLSAELRDRGYGVLGVDGRPTPRRSGGIRR
ncbi:NAD-dependent epimerase/dehydratase family protein [Halorubrum sp. DTA46]